MDVPVRVWQDDESWYAEAVTMPVAHAIGGSRAEALENLRLVLADLKAHGLLTETAELATVQA